MSGDGGIFFKSHDTMVWDWDDPSESYDRLEGHRSTMWPARFEHTDTNERTWAQTTAGDCTADGTPIGGYASTLMIGTRAVTIAGAGPLALSDDQTLYVGTFDALVALDLHGNERWRARVDGGALHPVVDGRGRIFCVGSDDRVRAIGPAGNLEWTFEIPDVGIANRLHGLALGAGRLCVAMFDTLMALGD